MSLTSAEYNLIEKRNDDRKLLSDSEYFSPSKYKWPNSASVATALSVAILPCVWRISATTAVYNIRKTINRCD